MDGKFKTEVPPSSMKLSAQQTHGRRLNSMRVQAGCILSYLTDMIKEVHRRMIIGEETMNAYVSEIAAELATER